MRIFCLLVGIICVNAINAQTVSTTFGQIQGTNNGASSEFLGIPFAKPPVGSLRWKAPLNPDAWATILSTTSFAPVCPQKKFEQGDTTYAILGDEDCLYLNVWTPQMTVDNLPVMVYIHGGGNQQGGTSQSTGGTQIFHGQNLAERGNAVVVTIQYRLGVLGYLVHPGLEQENANNTAGNYAVLDQLLALEWVKNNISNFGGDSTNIMVFGESAGGVNVGNLLTTPLASGLFERACIQSAVPTIGDYTNSKNKGIAFVDSFSTSGTNAQKIAEMRNLQSDSLLYYITSPIQGGLVQMNWQPVVDGFVFMDFPMQVFQSGNFNKVPLIIGSNSDEMSLSVPQVVTPFMVTALVNTTFPTAFQSQAHVVYPSGTNNTEAKETFIKIMTDAQFTATTRRTARCISLNQTAPVWRYFFSHKHTISALEPLGAYHGMELFYIFNNWENAILGSGILFGQADDSVQNVMLDYWTNFANTGDPNTGLLENWPQYASSSDCYIELKATPNGSNCGLRTVESDLWDSAFGFSGCTSSLGMSGLKSNYSTHVIYPNPTNEIVNILVGEELGDVEINVFTHLGKLVHTAKNTSKIDLNYLTEGIYYIRMNTKDRSEVFLVNKRD